MKRKQENFSLPTELVPLTLQLVSRFGGEKTKWQLYVAAILALAKMEDGEIRRRIGEVARIDAEREFQAVADKLLVQHQYAVTDISLMDERKSRRRHRPSASRGKAGGSNVRQPAKPN